MRSPKRIRLYGHVYKRAQPPAGATPTGMGMGLNKGLGGPQLPVKEVDPRTINPDPLFKKAKKYLASLEEALEKCDELEVDAGFEKVLRRRYHLPALMNVIRRWKQTSKDFRVMITRAQEELIRERGSDLSDSE